MEHGGEESVMLVYRLLLCTVSFLYMSNARAALNTPSVQSMSDGSVAFNDDPGALRELK